MKPADFPAIHWMEWFADDIRSHWAKGMLLSSDGQTFATDGMLCVIDRTGTVTGQICERQPCAKAVSDWMNEAHKATDWKPMPFDELVAFCWPCEHPRMDTCPKCQGKKKVSHDCPCEYCTEQYEPCNFCEEAGECKTMPEARPGNMIGLDMDCQILSYLFAHASKQSAYEWRRSKQTMQIRTPEWMAFMQSMDLSLEKRPNVPKFQSK